MQEEKLPTDMSFLEYLGTMIEVDGQLLDVTEVFAEEIARGGSGKIEDAEPPARLESDSETAAELSLELPEVRP
ncbi:MAG: hypothetical protein ACFHXK_19510 [bacterium]